ncbi:tRNA (Guanine-N(1)-)-methyltransferase [Coniochaeta hoffmannii]|uniref:tRNA (guanine(9)-N1)-methyltransferase n=1 Tax=Coniochaeta hoffmannii TaxID=91930 RepID=A0AA38S211_9PEZI|nr:tRNA (Guanine-N(1)-)-methyltransferase [Coniochaeta hoffmannii]
MEESRIPGTLPPQQGDDESHTADSAPHEPSAEPIDNSASLPQGTKRAREESENGDKPMSKNQLKRLRRQQAWEESKESRKLKRKEKRHEKQARKRSELEEKLEAARQAGLDPEEVRREASKPAAPRKHNPVPVAFIIDCDFERYMLDNEVVSLSSQVVRSYSMNRTAKYQAHLFVSSFGGKMKERFETVLEGHYKKWRHVQLIEGDFLEAARLAGDVMKGEGAGEVIDVLKTPENEVKEGEKGAAPEPEPEEGVDRSIVYLTSDSPYTLERLEPNTSYVIGGIVDRNREKGLCYKRAVEKKVRTAKLPIGEYMAMQSRFVLTTNQVVEIMAKWLECGDWGQAFLHVIPQRKGGVLKGAQSNTEHEDGQELEEARDKEDDNMEAERADGEVAVEGRVTQEKPSEKPTADETQP